MGKYDYFRIIQCDYGYGFDDVCFYAVNSKNVFKSNDEQVIFKSDFKSYLENKHGQFAIRVVFRKYAKRGVMLCNG
jgi:hypothetical protein